MTWNKFNKYLFTPIYEWGKYEWNKNLALRNSRVEQESETCQKQTMEALRTPIKVLWNAKKQFLGEDLIEGTDAKQAWGMGWKCDSHTVEGIQKRKWTLTVKTQEEETWKDYIGQNLAGVQDMKKEQ